MKKVWSLCPKNGKGRKGSKEWTNVKGKTGKTVKKKR